MASPDPRHKGSQTRVATAVVQARIARKTQQKPSDGSTHWPCRKMAEALGAQQLDRAASVGASAVEAASAGPLPGLQRSTV